MCSAYISLGIFTITLKNAHRLIKLVCASVSRILVWLRILPPIQRHPSLWVPSPTRSSELCAPVATLTRTSLLSFNSYVRRKASECGGGGGGLQYMQTYAPTAHTPVSLIPLCTRETEGCGPINILYVGTCPLIALADTYFYSNVFLCMVKMLKLTLDQYLEAQSVSSSCKARVEDE